MKLSQLTPTQVTRLARLLGTTVNALRHAVKGRRGVSAERAIAIERAAKRMGLDIRREGLSAACQGCEFAKACRKQVAP